MSAQPSIVLQYLEGDLGSGAFQNCRVFYEHEVLRTGGLGCFEWWKTTLPSKEGRVTDGEHITI